MKRLASAWPIPCALLSGALFAAALPPRDREWLGWIALAPLLAAASVPGRRSLHAVGLGLLAGIAAGAFTVGAGDGVAPDRLNFAYLPYIWIGLVFGGVCALAALARPLLERWPLAWAALVACAGVAVEWLTAFTPLPVGIALCQWRNVPLIQTAAVAGIWGVSWLLWLANAAAAAVLLRRDRPAAVSVATAAAVIFACLGLGRVRLVSAPPRDTVTVAAVQDFSGTDGAAANPDGTRGGAISADLPDLAALMREAAKRDALLIVGSEEALGSAFTPDDAASDPAVVARETGRYLAVGYQELGSPKDRNCAALVGPDGKTRGVHRKVHLFLGERNAVQAGDSPTVVDTGDSRLGKVGLLICFDTGWTDLARKEAASGARIVALPNFDPPVPAATLHYLHAAEMPFRAVENGIALVRADPNGLSSITDPWGRTVARAPLYKAEAVVADVPLGDGRGTPFTRLGDWPAWLCAAAVLGTAAARMRKVRASAPPRRSATSPSA